LVLSVGEIPAILVTMSGFGMSHVGLVGDRRDLQLLLSFASGNLENFRINIEVVASTVLFSTWSTKKINLVQGSAGYGREFEQASIQKPYYVRSSIIHNRVVSYTLGEIIIILRDAIDACTPHKGRRKLPKAIGSQTPTGLTVVNAGTLVGSTRIVEIKTGSVCRVLRISKALSQIWFSQTPILCRGYYKEPGIFFAYERGERRGGREVSDVGG
jgi:hypothetical protein